MNQKLLWPTDHISVRSDPTPILDHRQRTIGICAGRPDDPTWEKTQQDAASLLKDARERCRFPSKSLYHRRGQFPALARGASFGGGQSVRA